MGSLVVSKAKMQRCGCTGWRAASKLSSVIRSICPLSSARAGLNLSCQLARLLWGTESEFSPRSRLCPLAFCNGVLCESNGWKNLEGGLVSVWRFWILWSRPCRVRSFGAMRGLDKIWGGLNLFQDELERQKLARKLLQWSRWAGMTAWVRERLWGCLRDTAVVAV